MTRLWLQITVAFCVAFLGVSAVFRYAVDPALFVGAAEPVARGGVRVQALYVLVVWVVFIAVAWALARQALKPLRRLQAELERLDPGNVLHRVSQQAEAPELDELIVGINALVSRVHVALGQLDRFAAQVAHELRLPLTLARLRLEQSANDLPENVVDDLTTELERLSHFVDQTLLLAKAEQGNLPLKRTRVDLAALVADIAEGIALLAEAEGRALDLDAEPAVIDFDADYTKQIVYNLLANALRHGSGHIRVRVRERGGSVRCVVTNELRAVPSRHGSLGSGRRIVAALAALHRGMRVRYRQTRGLYVVRVVVAAAAS